MSNDHDAIIKEAVRHHRRLSTLSNLDDPLLNFFDATPNELGVLHSPPSNKHAPPRNTTTNGRSRSQSLVEGSLAMIQRLAQENASLKASLEQRERERQQQQQQQTNQNTTTFPTESFQRHVQEIQRLRAELETTEEALSNAHTQLENMAPPRKSSSPASNAFKRHVKEIEALRLELSLAEDQLEALEEQEKHKTKQHHQQNRVHERNKQLLMARIQDLEIEQKETASASPSIDFFQRQLKSTQLKLTNVTHQFNTTTIELNNAQKHATEYKKEQQNQQQHQLKEEERINNMVLKFKSFSKELKRNHEIEIQELKHQHSFTVADWTKQFNKKEQEHSFQLQQAVSLAVKTTTATLRQRHEAKMTLHKQQLEKQFKTNMTDRITDEITKEKEFLVAVLKKQMNALKKRNLQLKEQLTDDSNISSTMQDTVVQLEHELTVANDKHIRSVEKATQQSVQVNVLKKTLLDMEQTLIQEQRKVNRAQEEQEHESRKHARSTAALCQEHEAASNALREKWQQQWQHMQEDQKNLEQLKMKYQTLLDEKKAMQHTVQDERISTEKNNRAQLLHRQEIQATQATERDQYEQKLNKIHRTLEGQTLNLEMKSKENDALNDKIIGLETEVRISNDRCKRLQEEASKAQAAATSAFETSEHAKHGVLAHALKAKQSTIEILQEQLLQQQQGHMHLAKRSNEEARRTQDQHQTTCKRLERDFQRALTQAQKGAEKQIESLTLRMADDEAARKDQTYLSKKRYQNEMERVLTTHQSEIQNISRQLEHERERCRALRRQSNVMQRDLEEAAVGGMMTILNTIEVSDGVGGNGISHLVDVGGSGSGSGRMMGTNGTSLHMSGMSGMSGMGGVSGVKGMSGMNMRESGGGGSGGLTTPILKRSYHHNASEQDLQRPTMPQPFHSPPHMNVEMNTTDENSDENGNGLNLYHHQGLSAELYRTRLDHVAVRSKTEQRLRAARREMASARAIEKQLEAQALEYGFTSLR